MYRYLSCTDLAERMLKVVYLRGPWSKKSDTLPFGSHLVGVCNRYLPGSARAACRKYKSMKIAKIGAVACMCSDARCGHVEGAISQGSVEQKI